MKRATALRPLSREHLAALTCAKRLREMHDASAAACSFLGFWERDGQRHFRIEEEVLLPAWATKVEMLDWTGVNRMLDEHLEIRKQALRLRAGEGSDEEIRALGALLHDHVRFEERSLFPRIEADLCGAALAELARAIERAEAE